MFRAADLYVREYGSLKGMCLLFGMQQRLVTKFYISMTLFVGRGEEETVKLLEDCTTNVLASIGIPNNEAAALTASRLKPYIVNL